MDEHSALTARGGKLRITLNDFPRHVSTLTGCNSGLSFSFAAPASGWHRFSDRRSCGIWTNRLRCRFWISLRQRQTSSRALGLHGLGGVIRKWNNSTGWKKLRLNPARPACPTDHSMGPATVSHAGGTPMGTSLVLTYTSLPLHTLVISRPQPRGALLLQEWPCFSATPFFFFPSSTCPWI